MFKQFTQLMIAAIVLFALPMTISNAKLADNEFVCHVSTVSGIDGIVMIQTNTIKDAISAALSANAHTIDGKRSIANQVIECVKKNEQRFIDYTVQQFYENLPQ